MATQAQSSSQNGMIAAESKLEANANPAAKPSFPEGGVRAWSVVFGASIALGCAFGYLSAFGYVSVQNQNVWAIELNRPVQQL